VERLRWAGTAAPPAVQRHRSHITGHNLFVSAYHGFAQIGNEHIPELQPWADFPEFFPELLSCENIDGRLLLKFKVNIKDTRAKSYRLHLRIQLTNQGTDHNPGKMRTFIADRDCTVDEDTAAISIPDYRSLWQLPTTGPIDAHCRFTLIDTATGYRGQYQKRKLENLQIID